MVREQLAGILVRHFLDVAEIGVIAGLREPVDGPSDLFLAKFGLSGRDASLSKGG